MDYERAAVAAALRREAMRAGAGQESAQGWVSRWEASPEAQSRPWVPVTWWTREKRRRGVVLVARKKVTQVAQVDPPTVAAARRHLVREGRAADCLYAAANELEDCGKDWVAFACDGRPDGATVTGPRHVHHRRRLCGLASLCPDCARVEAARLAGVYGQRVTALLDRSRAGTRARLVTLALRPHGAETLSEAFERCREHGKRVLRVLYGIPATRADWSLYRRVYPITDRELALAGSYRRARAARRRRLKANRARLGAGWLVAAEFGEQGMKAHVHAVVVGRYIPVWEIVKAWHLETGDSIIADVRLCTDVREVCKYPVKFMGRRPAELAALYRAVCDRRRIEAFGALRGRCPGELEPREPVRCPECGARSKAFGIVPASFWVMGVRSPPEQFCFHARAGP